MSAVIDINKDDDQINVNYTLTLGTEEIEITGTLQPYKTGRCVDYNFEPDTFVDDISEGYWDENWEDIEEEILNYFYNSVV